LYKRSKKDYRCLGLFKGSSSAGLAEELEFVVAPTSVARVPDELFLDSCWTAIEPQALEQP